MVVPASLALFPFSVGSALYYCNHLQVSVLGVEGGMHLLILYSGGSRGVLVRMKPYERRKVFAFADKYRRSYSNGLKSYVCPFYCSYSGYQDELLWGAAWLHKATKNPAYLNYIQVKGQTLGVDETDNTFRWDNQHVGARILLSLKPNTPQVFSLPLLPVVLCLSYSLAISMVFLD
ncbi:hypothetical protein AAC387_Pa03g2537 [Persea americana]